MLLRNAAGQLPSYQLPLSPQQEAWTLELLDILKRRPTYSVFQPLFQDLAHSLLTECTPDAFLDPFKFPLTCFTTLSSLKADGSFEQPTAITPRLAITQWGFKMVVFNQIQRVMREKEFSSGRTMEE